MKVFITGGSGFVGSAVIPELISAGHEVFALARSKSAAEKVEKLGAIAIDGDLSDANVLKQAATESNAVIHLAYNNNLLQAKKAARADRAAITAIAEALKGTDKPFIITGGVTGIFGKKQTGSELEVPKGGRMMRTRLKAEKLLFEYTSQGVKAMAIRLSPFVHGEGDKGLTFRYFSYVKKNKQANYIGKGENIWPAVHRLDVAHLFLLALEKGKAGSVYHAIAEGVTAKQVAERASENLSIPLKSVGKIRSLKRFSWFSVIVSLDTPANSRWTREQLGWEPTHTDYLSDLKSYID